MRRILVLNTKGGCGKTTISSNLAAQYASRGFATAILDCDPQASSMCWLQHRPNDRPPIHGICASPVNRTGITRSWQLRVPPQTERLIVDTPAALTRPEFNEQLRGVDLILIPVQASAIDTRAAADFIRDLLLINKVHQYQERVAIVANRTREHTLAFQSLERFLSSLRIPVIAKLRDTQSYVRAAELGLGVHELDTRRARQEALAWEDIIAWLERERSPRAVSG